MGEWMQSLCRVGEWGGYGQVCKGRCVPSLDTEDRCKQALRILPPTPRVRYTVLTGTPPFVVGPLSEMYQNIRDGRYPEPAHLSPNARRLIARLLAPNPAERPSLDHLLQDDFFTQVCGVRRVGHALGWRGSEARRPVPGADPVGPPKGFTPDRLPARSCHSPPFFTVPQPLGRLFRKVGRLLLPQCRPPCEYSTRPPLACSHLPGRLASQHLSVLPPALPLPSDGRGGCGGPGFAPRKVLCFPQAPSWLARPRVLEKVDQILTPWSGAVR